MPKWIGFTTIGWIVGIPLLMAFAGVLEPVGLGRAAIALGMGTGLAFFQWLAIRKVVENATPWLWVSPLSFTVPFLFADLIGKEWLKTDESAVVFGTLTGAAIMALTQYRVVLKLIGTKLMTWVVVNILAYALALVPPFTITVVRINELQLPGALSIALSFLTVLAGGPIIGWLTGLILVRRSNPVT